MYLDRVKITIKAGNGGNGHTSFHHSKLTMNGGPDGGDGGRGGDVIFVANEGLNTLYGFTFKNSDNSENIYVRAYAVYNNGQVVLADNIIISATSNLWDLHFRLN